MPTRVGESELEISSDRPSPGTGPSGLIPGESSCVPTARPLLVQHLAEDPLDPIEWPNPQPTGAGSFPIGLSGAQSLIPGRRDLFGPDTKARQ